MKLKRFAKWKNKFHLSFESENLAVPEVHTGEVEAETITDNLIDAEGPEELSVQYDTVAIPEIHVHKEK